MADQNESRTIPQLFADKAKVEAEIRKFRAQRIFMTVAAMRDGARNKIFIVKKVEELNAELKKIVRNYYKIDMLIDDIEIKIGLEDD